MLILVILSICVLAVASLIDLKTREVPDWLSYGYLFGVLGILAIGSVESGWQTLGNGIIGALLFFVIGYLFYLSRQWGGGDVKLFAGIGAVLGMSWNMAWYFVLLLVAGSAYGLLYLSIVAFAHQKEVLQEAAQKIKEWRSLHLMVWLTAILFVLLGFAAFFFWLLAPLPPLIFYLFFLMQVVEKTCFIRWITPQQATEGDWLAQPVHRNGKLLMGKRTLTKKDILFLETAAKKICIKDGIPFVPSFLLAYIIFLFVPQIPFFS